MVRRQERKRQGTPQESNNTRERENHKKQATRHEHEPQGKRGEHPKQKPQSKRKGARASKTGKKEKEHKSESIYIL